MHCSEEHDKKSKQIFPVTNIEQGNGHSIHAQRF